MGNITVVTTLIVGSMIVAVVIGLAANRYLKGRDHSKDDDGITVVQMIAPIATLASLILAFVTVGASTSFSAARDAATREAGLLDNMYETAEYLPEPLRKTMLGQIVCYTRSVPSQEWPGLDDGKLSAVTSGWSTKFRQTFAQIREAEPSLFASLSSADNSRSEARRNRLIQAQPTVQPMVFAFALFMVVLVLAGFGYSMPRRNHRPQLIALMLVSLLWGTVLYLIYDMDRSVGGLLTVKPTQIVATDQDITEDYVAAYGATLPCDADGNPT